jgi:hypothetical protein
MEIQLIRYSCNPLLHTIIFSFHFHIFNFLPAFAKASAGNTFTYLTHLTRQISHERPLHFFQRHMTVLIQVFLYQSVKKGFMCR